jgi:hypothetical protein
MNVISTALAALIFIVPQVCQAEQITAKDPESIARFFSDEGLEVTLKTDSAGDPKINVDYYGTSVPIYFYGCRNNNNCTEIQLFSGYKTEGGVRLTRVNEWNAQNRFSRAYISDSGSTRIEHDVYLGRSGLSADDFAALMGVWVTTVLEFEEFIDW